MRMGFIGLGRMGVVQARLARHFGDAIAFGVDRDAAACAYFAREFSAPVVPTIAQAGSGLPAPVDVLWVTVCDGAIGDVAAELGARIPASCVVLHTSGALSSDVLRQALPQCACASFHPLMACPLKEVRDDECVRAYDGIIHAYEGDDAACAVCQKLLERLHGDGVQIETRYKTLYHAGAVFSSNYILACLHTGCLMLERCGLSPEQAVRAALRMCRQNLDAVESSSLADALTGPVKRRDWETIRRHEAAIEADMPTVLALYRELKAATERLATQEARACPGMPV